MLQKQPYESLQFRLIFLTADDVVRTSTQSGANDGEDSGTRLPPDFD